MALPRVERRRVLADRPGGQRYGLRGPLHRRSGDPGGHGARRDRAGGPGVASTSHGRPAAPGTMGRDHRGRRRWHGVRPDGLRREDRSSPRRGSGPSPRTDGRGLAGRSRSTPRPGRRRTRGAHRPRARISGMRARPPRSIVQRRTRRPSRSSTPTGGRSPAGHGRRRAGRRSRSSRTTARRTTSPENASWRGARTGRSAPAGRSGSPACTRNVTAPRHLWGPTGPSTWRRASCAPTARTVEPKSGWPYDPEGGLAGWPCHQRRRRACGRDRA